MTQEAPILRETSGERLVNHVRLGVSLACMIALASVWGGDPPAGGATVAVLLGAWFAWGVGVQAWFLRRPLPADSRRSRPRADPRWLAYAGTTVDLGVLSLVVVAVHREGGAAAYFGGALPFGFVFWNVLAGLRLRPGVCFYAAGLTALAHGFVLAAFASPDALSSAGTLPGLGPAGLVLRVLLLALPAALVGAVAYVARSTVERAAEETCQRERRERGRAGLVKHVGSDRADAVLASGVELAPGAVRRSATVLFVDIRRFTPLTESRAPEEIVDLLNEYFEDMVRIVFRHGGMHDKYLGDGLMAVFGLPLELPAQTKHAVLAALDMNRALERFNERVAGRGFPPFSIGIGVASGPVIAGHIGAAARRDYTCIGTAVNLAARLQALSRDLGADIVLSATAADALGETIPCRALPPVLLRGTGEEVSVHVIDPSRVSEEAIESLRLQVLRAEGEQEDDRKADPVQ